MSSSSDLNSAPVPPRGHQPRYLTAPDPNQTGWPPGVPYIIGNEGCERFSFYGMKSILQVHLTGLFLLQGLQDRMAEEHAQEMVHLFVAGVYAFPIIGAIIADRLLGKYRTIIWLSLVYCLGHFVLALAENSIQGMWLGLGLIAIGSGGIKPCVSANVGDQFGPGNWHLVAKIFQAFYFIINFGSFFATLAIPAIRAWEQEHLDWSFQVGGYEFTTSLAFGLPGLLMLIATIMFWMGRNVFVHVPPNPGGKLGLLDTFSSSMMFMGLIGLPMFFWDILDGRLFWVLVVGFTVTGLVLFQWRQRIQQDDGFLAVLLYSIGAWLRRENARARSLVSADVPASSIQRHWLFAAAARKFDDVTAEGPLAVLKIISVFLMVSVFWALFDQHASSWIRQAMQMDLDVMLGSRKLISVLPSQMAAMNPLMVMTLIPFNNFVLYPWIDRNVMRITPLRKMTVGMFIASLAFVAVALLQSWIETAAGQGEKVPVLWQFFPYLIMTQAEVMISITGLEFAYTQAPKRMKSTIMGFWLLAVALGNTLVVFVTKLPDMPLLKFFWVFAGLMGLAAIVFGLRAAFYRYKDYTQ
jgi:proton-dependent oligopeptide transporter, POT family